ncbi:MAG: hypothetical protein JRH19_26715 [Deltaproteobacteria bacterium]|nr:hypothetical protein [Deltaproteobacteria bacterium]
MKIERANAPCRRSCARWATPLAVGFAALICAASASADFAISLTTGGSFNSGSAIALGTNPGLFSTRDLSVTTTPSGVPGVLDIEIAGIDPIPTIQPALEPTVFHFTLASNPQLSFDTVAGTINGALTDPTVEIQVDRQIGGTTIDSDSYPLSFTTGTLQLPSCGPAAARSVTGSFFDSDPNDQIIDEVTLVAAVCMLHFGNTAGFDTALQIKLTGTIWCPDTDDGVACTADTCDLSTFTNIHTPDDSLCDDDNLCTGDAFCDPVLDCQPGPPVTIDDGIACTIDTCSALVGIANIPADSLCSDGDLCTGIEACDASLGCQAGTPPVVDDGVACTIDSCSALAGVANIPDDLACDDASICTGFEFCSPTLGCLVGTPLAVDDGVACTTDECDPVLGVSNSPDDSACSDADACTGIETCDATLDCQPGTPPIVDDGIGCTLDSCDPVVGVSNSPDDSVCDDADVCTGIEFCDPALDCQAGTPLAFDDGIDCTTDLCDPVDGVANVPNHDACSDGSVCNGSEICDLAQGCLEGAVLPPLVWEDFESLPLQNDAAGVYVPSLGETLYSVSDIGGTVATVLAVDQGRAAISESDLGGRVWTIESTSEGPFVADVSIPPDPDAEFSGSGTIGTFFAEPVDLRSSFMCVDVREVFQERDAELRFVIGDADGNFGVSAPIGPLPVEFATFEHSFGNGALEAMDGANGVDLARVQTLGFDFWTYEEGSADPFVFEVDDLRIIPEPDSNLLVLCGLGTLSLLRAASERRLRGKGK